MFQPWADAIPGSRFWPEILQLVPGSQPEAMSASHRLPVSVKAPLLERCFGPRACGTPVERGGALMAENQEWSTSFDQGKRPRVARLWDERRETA